ncbi:MAG: (Fe-S)-binding protein [Anaerolineae bacterium]|nr:(Fe-S)-binding protein [Anaerolineae bacterium]
MLTSLEKILFIVAVFISLYFTYVNFGRMFKIIWRGQSRLSLDHFWRRLGDGLMALSVQGRMIYHRPFTYFFHFLVVWGFLYYLLVNVAAVFEGYISGFRFLGTGLAGNIYRLLTDILSLSVLAGMAFFVIRRFLAKDPALTYQPNVKLHPLAWSGIFKDSLIVSGFIVGHVGFHFLDTSFLVALEGGNSWQPGANFVAHLWRGLSPTLLETGWHVSWWLAFGLILAFLPYFPYSKHIHLLMGPFNFVTRPPRKIWGGLPPLNFDDETVEQFGATRLTDLDQTHLVDAFACIMCNRCQDVCPAYLTGKELSPAALEINKRYYIRENMGQLATPGHDPRPLLEYALNQSAVWACTTCGACVEVCPVGNQPMADILAVRRQQVLMESAFPYQLKGAFTGMERNNNPWQMSENRLSWANSLDFHVPTVAENRDFEILFWVGCAGAFDPDAQKISRAIAAVLRAAGVNFAVLGQQEACTGDIARRAGNEYLFAQMAQKNIELLNEIGADKKTIITGCPHCLHTLGQEYADFGGHYVVRHHTQFIAELIQNGRLKLTRQTPEKITFHDPCYLGRYSREYHAPREILAKTGATLVEMNHAKSDSFCCGAGGGQMWKEEEHGAQAVNMHRYLEAAATGAETLAVGCPFCGRMLKDAGTTGGTPSLKIQDVAELVATQI